MYHPQVSKVLQFQIHSALEDFLASFSMSVINSTHEINLTSHFLRSLEIRLPRNYYDTDIEYNRKNLTELKNYDGKNGVITRPDILIHKRGRSTRNRLAIEMKNRWKGSVDFRDREKLKMFTDQSGSYHYDFGLFLSFVISRNNEVLPRLIWFRDGEELQEVIVFD